LTARFSPRPADEGRPGHEVQWRRAEAYGRRHMGQTVRFQEILRRLAMIDEGFVETRPDQT
jgi:hypothetical protein